MTNLIINVAGKIKSEKDRPHSYEFGKANNRHKIYYEGEEDLKQHLAFLKNMGLIEVDEEK